MKRILFAILLGLFFSSTLFLPTSFAQDITQWNLPEGAKARLGKGGINTIAYSQDGTRLAVGSSIGVWIYDAHSGEELKLFTGQKAWVQNVDFSPDGKMLASCGNLDKHVYLWDVNTGRLLHKIIADERTVKDVKFSPDGKVLASGGWQDAAIRLWDLNTGSLLREFTGYNHSVDSVAFSPDGKTIVGVSEAQAIIWDIETAHPVRTFSVPNTRFNKMALSPDFQTLAINGIKQTGDKQEGFIYLWDVESGKQKHTIELSVSYIDLLFSPDSQLLLGTEWNSPIYVWNVQTGEQVDSFFSGESQQLSKPVVVLQGIGGWAFTPDGQTLALGSLGGYIELWDANTFQYMSPTNITGHSSVYVYGVAFSNDGKTIASGHGDTRIRLWDPHTGKFKREIFGHTSNVSSVAFSPTEPILASGSYDRTIRLWALDKPIIYIPPNIILGGALHELKGHTQVINTVVFSPNGKILASGSHDGTIRLWDVKTGQLLHTLTEYRNESGIAFSPNGSTLASGDFSTIRLWDVETGTFLRTIGEDLTSVKSIAFSPDGQVLVSGSRNDRGGSNPYSLRLWDVSTGQHLRTFAGNWAETHIVMFTPDGKMLATTGGNDGTVRLWDVCTGSHLRTYTGHTGRVNGIVFSKDGKTLVTGSDDSSILLWDLHQTLTELDYLKTDANTDETINVHDFFSFTIKAKGTGKSAVRKMLFSPDEQTLASVSEDGSIRFFEANTGQHLRTILTEYTNGTRVNVLFSADGQTLASQNWYDFTDKTILLWDVETGKLLKTILTEHRFSPNMVFSPDGQTLASWDYSSVSLWDVGTAKHLHTIPTGGSSVTFSPDGQLIARCSGWEGILLWDVDTGQHLNTIPTTHACNAYMLFSPNGQILANWAIGNKTIDLWDSHTGKILHTLTDHTQHLHGIMFSPDGQMIASWDLSGKTIHLWDSHTGKTLRTLTGHTDQLILVSFSPDGHTLAAGSSSQVLFFNTANGGLLNLSAAPLHLKQGGLLSNYSSIALSPDWQTFAAGYRNGSVRLWGSTLTLGEPGCLVRNITDIADINSDGVVNIQDLVLVAGKFGETGESAADVNGDGVVDIRDLVLVAGALGNVASAPTAWRHNWVVPPTRAEVEAWLREARRVNLSDPAFQRGIHILEQLLAELTPKETALLPNYPNPFNPETWIPYHLARPADVSISIYTVDGKLVRTLSLGHRLVGIYESRSRAAYWDGKNELGESVASSVYFYTITAGEFTATRKMVIRK